MSPAERLAAWLATRADALLKADHGYSFTFEVLPHGGRLHEQLQHAYAAFGATATARPCDFATVHQTLTEWAEAEGAPLGPMAQARWYHVDLQLPEGVWYEASWADFVCVIDGETWLLHLGVSD